MARKISEHNFDYAVRYLSYYGYLAQDVSEYDHNRMASLNLTEPVKKFQKRFGIPETGVIDEKTFRAMLTPRCAFPDIVRRNRPDHEPFVKLIEFSNQSLPAWKKRNLKYSIQSFVSGISQAVQHRLIAEAFLAWTRHGNINAEPAGRGETPDIIIGTGSGRSSGFDGPGGVLAWAYLPTGTDRQLQMKFDLDETWLESPGRRGILYFNVACHEIGHIFGLDHSKVSTALMAPYYNPAIAVPQENDDIPRFQSRYGKRTAPPSAPPVPAPQEPHRIVITLQPGAVYSVELNGRQIV